MKVNYGIGNSIERPITELFGTAQATAGEVAEHFSDIFGFDADKIEVHVDGATLSSDSLVSDTCIVDLVPAANTKG